MIKGELLTHGKAKSLYLSDDPAFLVMEYRDDTSAFDGLKIASLERKGAVNNHFNAFIMQQLEQAGVATHFVRLLSDTESQVRRLQMFPVECVVRNISTGSLCKRLGVDEGLDIQPPTFEFFLKNDELHDPMINESHIEAFGWAERQHVECMKELTYQVNGVLKALFADAGLLLVDYKLEFGLAGDEVILGDEFTPDGCRLWDKKTRAKLDKDLFRQGQGGVVEAYEEVAHRLGVKLPD